MTILPEKLSLFSPTLSLDAPSRTEKTKILDSTRNFSPSKDTPKTQNGRPRKRYIFAGRTKPTKRNHWLIPLREIQRITKNQKDGTHTPTSQRIEGSEERGSPSLTRSHAPKLGQRCIVTFYNNNT